MMDLKLSAGEMIRAFKISRQTLGRWVEKGCPKVSKGVYSLPEVIEWRDKTVFSSGDAMSQAKLRRETAKALREELKAETEKGSLVSKDSAISWLTLAVSEARQGFSSLPKRLSSSLVGRSDPKDIEKTLHDEIHAILNILADHKKRPLKNHLSRGPVCPK